MKLAYITHKFPRTYNTFVVHEIIDFIKQGYDVYIFSAEHSNEKNIEASKRYNLLEKTTYLDNFINKKLSNHIKYIRYPDLKKNIHIIDYFSRYLKSNNFDYIHADLETCLQQ